MTSKTPYQYQMFSRRLGNLPKLRKFSSEIASFYSAYFPEPDFFLLKDQVMESIVKEMSGVVLAFAGDYTVGYMSFQKTIEDSRIFRAGFAFVDENYRKNKIWTAMSELVEDEVRKMGGQELRMEIAPENEFLSAHLQRREKGYTPYSPEAATNCFPLARRL